MSEQCCPICAASVAPSLRYPKQICSECWSGAVDEEGRKVTFGYLSDAGYCVFYEDSNEPRPTGICFIRGVRCWAGEDYWGGSVVAYPYDGEK
ncbi:MAG: hypothetical protein ABL984_17260 [Pyrinomonadaceae bacterium]